MRRATLLLRHAVAGGHVVAVVGKLLARREARFRAGRAAVDLTGATALVVDDGLATGYTARAAIDALRRQGASRVILAVPVGPPSSVAELRTVADRVCAVEQPEEFGAIGAFYADFGQTGDEEDRRHHGSQPHAQSYRFPVDAADHGAHPKPTSTAAVATT